MSNLFAFMTAAPSTPTVSDLPIPWSELQLTSLDGGVLDPAKLDGKVVLVVNVASKCGFTPQYDGLQQLYERYRDRGLEIVGVPCNQFGWQEPGDSGEIASFCRMNYGVGFSMLKKQQVNGRERSPLYRHLIDSKVGAGARVKWNFEKFLVGRDGRVASRFGSRTAPANPSLVTALERALDTEVRDG